MVQTIAPSCYGVESASARCDSSDSKGADKDEDAI